VSKRHQASRRRTYGRRQHDLRERPTRRGEVRDPVTGETEIILFGGRQTAQTLVRRWVVVD
jgi:hypothetical protein